MQFLPQEGIYNYGMDPGQRMINPMGGYPYTIVHEYIMIPYYYVCSEYLEQQNFASQYISTIQERFKDSGNNEYEQFMTIVGEYQRGQISVSEVAAKVWHTCVEITFRCSRYSVVMMILFKVLSCSFQMSFSVKQP